VQTLANLEHLKGHTFYALQNKDTKKRVRGCKYMGQEPIYVFRDRPSITIKRITLFTIDEIEKLVYTGMYDCGSTRIPMFKEKDNDENV